MSSRLFQPITVGRTQLKHRVVLAPLTRVRADDNHVPNLPIMKEYYSQRATMPGTLLITEATIIAPQAGGLKNAPGIYSKDQVGAWKEIVQGVRKNGSSIFCQLWAFGRQANEAALKADDATLTVVGPSPIPTNSKGASVPRELTIPEIKEYVQLYATAARNAIHEAHFDGVEIHCANGYLVDQFLQDVSNKRQDDYGGSVERRSRFGLEVIRAVVGAVGTAEKVGIRLSPWSPFGSMGMDDPLPQFDHFVSTLKSEFPDLAYIHVIEPRVAGDKDHDTQTNKRHAANDFLRNIWAPKPYISTGGYDRADAIRQADERENELVAFGRIFISNPDLPMRLEKDIPLTPYNRKTFYLSGDTSGKGYTDYPFAIDTKL
ncbi:NADH:flavin oxidoreductase/NADH oxidase [Macrolepiota fuliginosa MF-IS2]|uniref:NADH:flavin oxidoreductase/NADH oxidase n=1 Tax=Macrolepiota fuliginosa MF-IS2 TaxID=1400762 RepID=A0A9P5X656_9AGAR|nr:NADH:flavin oxidoreductase/NADH oxidase [Macrolepiota fuliginosa MF-IS2]